MAQCVLKVNRRLGTWCTLSIFTLPLTSGPAHWSTTLLPSRSHGFIAPALADRTDRLRVPVRVNKPTWAATRGRLHTRLLLAAGSRRSPHGDAGTSPFAARRAHAGFGREPRRQEPYRQAIGRDGAKLWSRGDRENLHNSGGLELQEGGASAASCLG